MRSNEPTAIAEQTESNYNPGFDIDDLARSIVDHVLDSIPAHYIGPDEYASATRAVERELAGLLSGSNTDPDPEVSA